MVIQLFNIYFSLNKMSGCVRPRTGVVVMHITNHKNRESALKYVDQNDNVYLNLTYWGALKWCPFTCGTFQSFQLAYHARTTFIEIYGKFTYLWCTYGMCTYLQVCSDHKLQLQRYVQVPRYVLGTFWVKIVQTRPPL